MLWVKVHSSLEGYGVLWVVVDSDVAYHDAVALERLYIMLTTTVQMTTAMQKTIVVSIIAIMMKSVAKNPQGPIVMLLLHGLEELSCMSISNRKCQEREPWRIALLLFQILILLVMIRGLRSKSGIQRVKNHRHL